jgi:hypothetical protein
MHAIDGYLSAVNKFENVSKADQLKMKRPLKVLIFDQKGGLIYNAYVDEVLPKIVPTPSPLAQVAQQMYDVDSNFVALSLNHDIGIPLSPAPSKTVLGQTVFIVGYPYCTGCDTKNVQVDDPLDFVDRSPRKNSDGLGLKVTTGHMLEQNDSIKFLNLGPAVIQMTQFNQLAFTDADSNHGNSGGPWLNERGEVLAIHTGGKSRLIDGKLQRLSRAVTPTLFFQK